MKDTLVPYIPAAARTPHQYARTLPDPKDRTINDPAVLVESKVVRAYYYNCAETGQVSVPSDPRDGKLTYSELLSWYERQALEAGWTNTERLGHSVLLTVKVSITDSRN